MLTRRWRVFLQTTCLASAAGLLAVPAAAVNIPEGGAVTPDSVFTIHFQVREGCDGAPMDTLEVAIPAAVQNPQPEAIDGWDVEVLPDTDENDDIETIVRWSGGPLEPDLFKEFGLWARFPDDPGAVLTFPAIQRCGATEVVWAGTEGDTPAPTVRLTDRVGQQDLQDLATLIGELDTRVEELSERMGDVNAPNLRSRVSDVEETLQQIGNRLDGFVERLDALEEEPPA